MIGAKRETILTNEYAEAELAARYPARDVSRSGLVTSGPFAKE